MSISVAFKPVTLLTSLSLFFTFLLSAQESHTVTLYVDTDNIQTNIPDPQLGKVCDFGQEEGVSNEAYLIEVALSDVVQWVGVAKNGRDTVNIEQILYVKGPNPFPGNRQSLTGGGEGRKTVSVEVTQRTGDQSCKYMLKFSVIRNGQPLNRVFNIDPEMRVR